MITIIIKELSNCASLLDTASDENCVLYLSKLVLVYIH
jgi:hypothetical protein